MHKWPVVFETQRCLYRGHGLAPEEEWSGVGAGQGVYFRSGPQRSPIHWNIIFFVAV